jgi:dTDP-glucose 4,6-dehydratase
VELAVFDKLTYAGNTGRHESLMTRVRDRAGDDHRHALSSAKLQAETGWSPAISFEKGLVQTIDWYRNNQSSVERVRSGEYQQHHKLNYGARAALAASGMY